MGKYDSDDEIEIEKPFKACHSQAISLLEEKMNDAYQEGYRSYQPVEFSGGVYWTMMIHKDVPLPAYDE